MRPNGRLGLVAEEIGRAGPTMVIENHPGAGAVIGTEAVSRAPPDGSTLLMLANSFVINPRLRKLNCAVPPVLRDKR
jgi:tripartite-type tricarboxylate transporter receptor subunit TctC